MASSACIALRCVALLCCGRFFTWRLVCCLHLLLRLRLNSASRRVVLSLWRSVRSSVRSFVRSFVCSYVRSFVRFNHQCWPAKSYAVGNNSVLLVHFFNVFCACLLPSSSSTRRRSCCFFCAALLRPFCRVLFCFCCLFFLSYSFFCCWPAAY